MAKPEKEAQVAALRDELEAHDAAIFTDYRGLKVKEMTELRARIREAGARYQVVKNSMLVRALNAIEATDAVPLVEGPIAIAWAHEEPTVAARVIADFNKAHGAPVLRGGLLSGRVLSAQEAETLATIPPREQMLAIAVGALQAPLAGLVTTLQGVASGLVGTLQAVAEKRGAEGAAAD